MISTNMVKPMPASTTINKVDPVSEASACVGDGDEAGTSVGFCSGWATEAAATSVEEFKSILEIEVGVEVVVGAGRTGTAVAVGNVGGRDVEGANTSIVMGGPEANTS